MGRLSVNVNKIATLRNARGGDVPNLVKVALDCEKFGAEGITVHPRPDERHIRYNDVYELSEVLTTEFNIEGYPSDSFLELIENVRPAQATLVPDPPGVLTSNAGWNVLNNQSFLKEVTNRLKSKGIRVSIFMECDLDQIEAAKKVEVDRIELYTGPYAEQYKIDPNLAIAPYVRAAEKADEIGLGINAGHDLDLNNLNFFRQQISGLLEVSIGHALVSDALYYGLDNTINMYLRALRWSHDDM